MSYADPNGAFITNVEITFEVNAKTRLDTKFTSLSLGVAFNTMPKP